MYIEAIIEEARDLLGDTKAPYLWSEKEMLRYYKNVVNQFCRETFIYTDESTEGVCYVYLLPGVHTYSLSPLVLAINDFPYLETAKSPVYPMSRNRISNSAYDWKYATGDPYLYIPNIEQQKIRVYPYYALTEESYFIGASNVSFTVTANTIVVASGFTVAGFEEDDHIVISGTSLNDGDFTIYSVSDTTIVTNEALATEALVSADIRTIVDTMIMNVARLPDHSLLTVDTWDTMSPPIPIDWHSKLVVGIMAQAYNKRDSEAYDPRERDLMEQRWQGVVQDAKAAVIMSSDAGERFNPNEGAI